MDLEALLDAQIAFLQQIKSLIAEPSADGVPPQPGAAPGASPSRTAEFRDIWSDAIVRPSLWHADLLSHSQTFLDTCKSELARHVAGVPQELWLSWRQPPSWYATDAQHEAWLRAHGVAGQGDGDGGTVVGPG